MEALLLDLALGAYLIGTIAAGAALVRPDERAARLAVLALAAGFLLGFAIVLVRSLELGVLAVSTGAEQTALFAWLLVGVYLVAQVRGRLVVLGALIGPIGFAGTLAALASAGRAAAVPDLLRSPWLPVHVTLAVAGDAAFALAGLVSAIYLWQEHQLKAHASRRALARLPSLETLDRMSFRLLLWGFLTLTLSVLAGLLWAELTHGRLLNWEPRTIWTMIVWLVYALLLHARLTVGWGGRRAARLTIAGFGVLALSLIGVNLLAPGSHTGAYG